MSIEAQFQLSLYKQLTDIPQDSLSLNFANQEYFLRDAGTAAQEQSIENIRQIPIYAQGDVPDNDVNLYVIIGNDTFIEWDTDGRTGFEGTIVIHTWDTTAENRSYIPLKNVMGDAYSLLHRAELPVMGYNSIGLDFEFSETFLDPDGLTRHGVQRFRVYMRG